MNISTSMYTKENTRPKIKYNFISKQMELCLLLPVYGWDTWKLMELPNNSTVNKIIHGNFTENKTITNILYMLAASCTARLIAQKVMLNS